LVVDATGHSSPLMKQLGLRDAVPALHTRTRSIFGHFTGVRDLDAALGGGHPKFRFKRDAGTMHHCFRGGWIWVIPFDNGITSVGLELDTGIYPEQEGLSPLDELTSHLKRFPSVWAHLGEMTPIRAVTKTGRLQFSSKAILADRFVATPHAAGFVEPLFSTGIMLTLSFVGRFIPAVKRAKERGNWGIEEFRPIEAAFRAEVEQIDLLVDGTIRSYRHFPMFKQYWRAWVLGTIVQYGGCVVADGPLREEPMLYGAGIDGYSEDLRVMHALVCSDADEEEITRHVKDLIDPWWERLLSGVICLNGSFDLEAQDAVNVSMNQAGFEKIRAFFQDVEAAYALKHGDAGAENIERWIKKTQMDFAKYALQYRREPDGSKFRVALDRIVAQANPDRYDYREHVGMKMQRPALSK
jgi:FADH2 O2-dependent halogenase